MFVSLCVSPYVSRQLPEKAERKSGDGPKKSAPFHGTTEYGDMHQDGFDLGDGSDMAAYRPPTEETGPFKGESEARAVFVEHPLDKGRKAVKARSHGIGVGEGAFKGQTEAQEAFPGHKVNHPVHMDSINVLTCGDALCVYGPSRYDAVSCR